MRCGKIGKWKMEDGKKTECWELQGIVGDKVITIRH